MTDLAWPSTIIPSGSEWRMVANTASFGPQAVARAGDRWACALSLPILRREQAAVLRAYLASLRGHTHRAVLPNHAYERLGQLSTDARVAGGSQTGTTLVVDGVEASLTNALRAGDLIGLDGRLYMVAADADSTSGGQLTLTLTHPITTAPADNATVSVVSPTGRFVFVGSLQWQNLPLGQAQVGAIEFLEDIP